MMDMTRAQQVLDKMCRDRYTTQDKVLAEYAKYQKNGECTHFWPDENTACKMMEKI
jgi:hypothetical protein